MNFSCVVAGQGPQLIACAEHLLQRGHRISWVITVCPEASSWAQKAGLNCIAPRPDLATTLGLEPFDYFFSIVNHLITPDDVLKLPRRGAINFHDSLLPNYGGFNAVSWAILDGQKEHGITWHLMTADVDGGNILLQKSLPISDDDTTFSLEARLGELAIRSFHELIAGIEAGSLIPVPGSAPNNFHFKSARPGFAVFDWRQPGVQFARLTRALDFGQHDSWMTRAKLLTPDGCYVIVNNATLLPGQPGPAGCILDASDDGITVATADGQLLLAGMTSLDGNALSAQQIAALGLTKGADLPVVSRENADAISEFDRRVTRSERFWRDKLASHVPPQLAELKPHVATGITERIDARLPAAISTLTGEGRRAALTSALATFCARTASDVSRIDLGLVVEDLPAPARGLYADVVPLSIDVPRESAWSSITDRASCQIEEAAQRKTYLRDAWTRYAVLRNKPVEQRIHPIAIDFSPAPSLPAGVRILFSLAPNTDRLQVIFDTGAITKPHAQRLADRLVHLLEAALRAPETTVGALPVVTPEEQQLLLATFQDTERPVTPACIQDLFAAQVARTPDKIALVFRDRQLTYRELDARSNAVASQLRALGVGPDQLVAISIERSIDMVIGLLGILKAGGAYVPLDPAYPAERLAIMLEDSGARWLLTQRHLEKQLPSHGAQVVLIETAQTMDPSSLPADATPENLAYVIFTSGSTGRPKGVMIEHRNVANFFAGMDERIGTEPGTWLAVTSISFDISVLEIFWTLTRGFEVVIQEESDRASLLKSQGKVKASSTPMDFGLFYFAADSTNAAATDAYRILTEGACFADEHGFSSVWTPERHFHAFGGLYPNASVTSAALAVLTKNVQIRAGSVVIALHDPIRVAEEWAVVDNLSNGRVGLSFASGWHANDFALMPENYARRKDLMFEYIDTVLRLWAGEKIKRTNGEGKEIEVGVLPRPVREKPPMWIAAAISPDTFRAAGRAGYNILSNMLGQDAKTLASNIAVYREARREAGHEGDGIISVMLHTFVTDSDDKARDMARGPFGNYLKSSYDLVKAAPWMFPNFKQPSLGDTSGPSAFDPSRFDENDMAALLDHAFDRYFDTAGLFGTPERALSLVEQLKGIGVNEICCLVDFGIDKDVVLDNLVHLDALRRLANPGSAAESTAIAPISIREQFDRHTITHFQCTPSMARMLVADGSMARMTSLRCMLVGGEVLPPDLAEQLVRALPQTQIINMYGPTEATVWSTTAAVAANIPITIGRPIANTQIRIVDAELGLLPIGTPGELCIGGAGVVRGYLHRAELTAERFVADPYLPGNRLYRTGDLARYRDDGSIDYIGRMDQQVKVNGYRIELGEIETILARHPAVKEAVVAVKESAADAQLVGYIIPSGNSSAPIDDWKQRWDEAYAKRAGASDAPVRFNTSGWLDSYTGEPIAAEHMREWLDQTVARILALKPKRVLEIGCGTGMILYACLPHVEHYTAVDISPHALDTIRNELTPEESIKVTLLNHAAHELDLIAESSCDLVVINSVAQYFPDADYLTQVLHNASRILVNDGHVFLGDLRSLEESRSFHALVEVQKAPGQIDATALAARIEEREALESELLVGKGFFADIERRVPRLGLASMQLKHGRFATEMRDFRYDVVLTAGAAPAALDAGAMQAVDAPSLGALRDALATKPALLQATNLRNARLDRVVAMTERMRQDGSISVEALRTILDEPAQGIDPNALLNLDADYVVELRFGQVPGSIDALFRHTQKAPAGTWPPSGTAIANTPRPRLENASLLPKLRAHLKDFLPDYMVPAAFVIMESFPLTPNGKTDRKALPNPTEKPRQAAVEFAMPANALERTIAQIWQDMLGVDRVGRKDNIFDLGASSLLTVEANNRLQTALGKKVPLVTMFRYPTIESLAAHLAKTLAPETEGPATATASVDQERQNRLASAAERRRQARAAKSI